VNNVFICNWLAVERVDRPPRLNSRVSARPGRGESDVAQVVRHVKHSDLNTSDRER
jgi:hypothetical protein